MADPTAVSGFTHRWRADFETGTADGGSLSTWADDPGTNDGSIGARTPVPTRETNEINGKSVVSFNNPDTTNDSRYQISPITGAFTVYVVARPTDPTLVRNFDDVQIVFATGNSDGYALGLNAQKWNAIVNTGAGLTTGTTTVSGGTTYAATMSRAAASGSNLNLFVNGTAEGTPTTTDATTASAAGWLGGWSTGTYTNWHGAIAEILFYNEEHDASERAQVHTYIQDTYGVVVSDYAGGTTWTWAVSQRHG